MTIGTHSFGPENWPLLDPSGATIALSYDTSSPFEGWWPSPDILWIISPGGSTSSSGPGYPGFDGVADKLTDGTDDWLWATAIVDYSDGPSYSAMHGWMESEMRISGMAWPGGDFAGYRIDAIEIEYQLGNTGLELNFGIEGEVVPVPAAVLLGTVGLGVAGWRLRRREMA